MNSNENGIPIIPELAFIQPVDIDPEIMLPPANKKEAILIIRGSEEYYLFKAMQKYKIGILKMKEDTEKDYERFKNDTQSIRDYFEGASNVYKIVTNYLEVLINAEKESEKSTE